MPLDSYRAFRKQIFICDTLKTECDSIILSQEKQIQLKDSTIRNFRSVVILKDSIIVEKNNTIKKISELKQPHTVSAPLFIGGFTGLLLGILLMR